MKEIANIVYQRQGWFREMSLIQFVKILFLLPLMQH